MCLFELRFIIIVRYMAAKKVKNQSTSTLSLMCGPLVQKAVRRLWQKQSFSFFLYRRLYYSKMFIYFVFSLQLSAKLLLFTLSYMYVVMCMLSEFEKGEYFSWSCHLDYKQTMSRDSTNMVCFTFFFFFNHVLSYSLLNALYLCVVLTCRLQGCH